MGIFGSIKKQLKGLGSLRNTGLRPGDEGPREPLNKKKLFGRALLGGMSGLQQKNDRRNNF